MPTAWWSTTSTCSTKSSTRRAPRCRCPWSPMPSSKAPPRRRTTKRASSTSTRSSTPTTSRRRSTRCSRSGRRARRSRTTRRSSRRRKATVTTGPTARRVSCPDAPTSSCASRASSCCRSDASPIPRVSTATTAPDPMAPAAPVTDRPWVRWSWVRLGAALVAGVVTGLCFPPVGLAPVVLVALVPLLWAWRDARPAHAALYGFAYGVAAYVVVIPWIRYFGYVAIVPLVVAMALAIAAVGALVAAYGRRGLASPFLTAAVWVVLEALHDVPAARTVASVGGTLFVSFVVVVVNGLLLDLGLALRAHTTRGAVLAGTGVAAIL